MKIPTRFQVSTKVAGRYGAEKEGGEKGRWASATDVFSGGGLSGNIFSLLLKSPDALSAPYSATRGGKRF